MWSSPFATKSGPRLAESKACCGGDSGLNLFAPSILSMTYRAVWSEATPSTKLSHPANSEAPFAKKASLNQGYALERHALIITKPLGAIVMYSLTKRGVIA